MNGQEKEQKTIDSIDARMLTDAIKELNISRRNVGLYPRDHPFTKESMGKAFRFLQKLFESRGAVALGVARDTLLIDGVVVDKNNPVLKEFALGLHNKGIAAVTLYAALTIEDLFCFHELITERDTPIGPALLELAGQRGLREIKLLPLDLSKFRFVDGVTREEGGENAFWNEYISGLFDGRLSEEDRDDMIATASPEKMASVINKNMPSDGSEKVCDALIQSYLGRRVREDRRAALFGKFLSVVDKLNPELKQQFLSKAFPSDSMDAAEVRKLLGDLLFEDIERMMKVFDEQSSLLPEKLQKLVNKLKLSKNDIISEIHGGGTTYLDDIEVDEKVVTAFREDHDSKFVDTPYSEELKKMMDSPRPGNGWMTDELEEACNGDTVDRSASKIMFELLGVESNSREEYVKLLANLADFADGFIETGRFSEIAEIYTTVYTHSHTGKFREEAVEMIKDFFGSGLVIRLVDAFKIWGKHNKEGVINLALILKDHLVPPLLNALTEEKDAHIRRFYLDVLCRIGSDVVSEAVKRLDNSRWHVTRNMLYLVRECNGSDYIKQIRRFTKHPDKRVGLEAVKTLLHFRTPDSISYIRYYLDSKDPLLREQAMRLAGTYRVRDAVPYLLEHLEKKDVFGTKSYNKTSVVRALGDIGDPSALKILRRICESVTLINRPELDRVKLEIFKSLRNYPFQDIKPLLELGLKSKAGEIRSISERLLKSGVKNG